MVLMVLLLMYEYTLLGLCWLALLNCCVSDSDYRKMLRMTVPLPLAVFSRTLIRQKWTIF